MIGILCATPEELTALRDRLHVAPEPRTFGPTRVWTGRHGGGEIALAQSGIGKVNAAAAATILLAEFGAGSLIFSGVAGGLNPRLGVGQVLLGARLAIHDYGMVSQGRFTPTASGVIPVGAPTLTELAAVSPDVAGVLARLKAQMAGRLEAPATLGAITTADYFLNCPQTRDELHARLGADAIDMESGAVAQIADEWDRPLYVIRTLSDLAGEDSHMDYPRLAAMAARNSALCVEELLAILA
ncbi:MAG TPA: 5'-methylthioadenosine/S-adenosylhomocysteine nucleosidase [Phenylobacterium sp.]|nr:5'-methylthioadenosine/S-adenosylhomocysteine nucleosidase [Phenylobacterium sp.]